MNAQRSLVLVTVDCFRADHAGWLGYERPTTPWLDSMASRALVFSNAIVAGEPTYYSLPAILASRHPLDFGRDVIGLVPREVTLASVLRDNGYATAAFVAGNPYLSGNFGYDTGFDVFENSLGEVVDRSDPGVTAPRVDGRRTLRQRVNRTLRGISYGLGQSQWYEDAYFDFCQRQASGPQSFDELRRFPAAGEIVDRACDWLRQNGSSPFFLWLHLMDPHAPYYPHEDSLQEMGHHDVDADRARYLNAYWNRSDLNLKRLREKLPEILVLYDSALRGVDTQLGRLSQFLGQQRQASDCVFAVTADHGEEFLEHGSRFHAPAAWEELIRVPLLILTSGGTGVVVKEPFSLVNLAPTLLESVGAAIPKQFRGQSWWHLADGSGGREETAEGAIFECVAGCTNPFRSENRLGPRILCVREAHFKMVIDFSSGQETLFDLGNDPGEIAPIATNRMVDVRRRMLRKASGHLAASVTHRDADARVATVLRDLRSGNVLRDDLIPA